MNNLPTDPFILLSFINTKLRDEYKSLDEMCEDMNLDRADIERRLAEAGFEYSPENNKFF